MKSGTHSMPATGSISAHSDAARVLPRAQTPSAPVNPAENQSRAAGGGDTIAAHPSLAVALAFALSLAFSWPRIVTIWQVGTFLDPDDAMRLVQIRSWLGGQGWFDLNAYRIDPPYGLFMHWSRVVDVPLAILIRGFELIYPAETAERLARIVFPLLMQIALLGAVARAAAILAGRNAILPAVLLTVLSGFMFVQFQPGRIDHDSPEIVLLILMLGSLLKALDPAHWRQAAIAALCAAAALAISLEDLPFVVVACAVPPIAWIWRGSEQRLQLLAYGLGLAAALSVAFVTTIGPARYTVAACDAFSIVHWSAGLGGALISVAMALLAPRSIGMVGRAALGVGAGLLLIVGVALAFPSCLGDPFSGMDPLLRELWLNNVTEARPLLALLALRPSAFPVVVLPVVLSAAAMLVAIWRETGVARARWIVVTAFVAAGIAGCFWEIRASTSLAPVALLGGTYACARIVDAGRNRMLARLLALVAMLPFSSMGWAIAAPINDVSADDVIQSEAAICREPDGFKALAALPPGLVFAPIDAGSHILVYTQDSVIAAPYHRNNRGNRMVLDAFLASPETAHAIILQSGARYVAFCPGETQLKVAAEHAPNGFAAALLAGAIPDWLQPAGASDPSYRIFTLR